MTEVEKHTPGEWNWAVMANEIAVLPVKSDIEICRVRVRQDGYSEALANARLMAASPKMLGALQEIVKQWPDSAAAKTARAALKQAQP